MRSSGNTSWTPMTILYAASVFSACVLNTIPEAIKAPASQNQVKTVIKVPRTEAGAHSAW